MEIIERINDFFIELNNRFQCWFDNILIGFKFFFFSLSTFFAIMLIYGSALSFAFSTFCILYIYGAWAAAFVGVHLWSWFIVPTFGLVTLTMTQAFGISLLFGYWTYHHFSQHIKDERTWKEKMPEVIGLISQPWIILLIGWVCHHFFM